MLSEFRALAVTTLRDPQTGIAQVLALGLSPAAIRMLAALAIVLEAMLNHALAQATLAAIGPVARVQGSLLARFAELADTGPMWLALHGLIAFALRSLLLHRMGERFGGQASADDSMLAVAWYDLLWSGFVAIAVVLTVVTPFLTAFFFGLGGLWMLWVMVNIVAGAHRFTRLGPVFLGVIAGYLAVQLILGFIPIL